MTKLGRKRKSGYREEEFGCGLAEDGYEPHGDEQVGIAPRPETPEYLKGFRSRAFKKPLDFRASIVRHIEVEYISELHDTMRALPRYSFRNDRLFPHLRVKFNTGKYTLKSEISPISRLPDQMPESIEHIRKIESLLRARMFCYKDFVPELLEIDIPLDPNKPDELDSYGAALKYLRGLFCRSSLNYRNKKGREAWIEHVFCLTNEFRSLYVKSENLLLVNIRPSPDYVLMLTDYKEDMAEMDFIVKSPVLSRRWFEVFKFFIEQRLLKVKGDDVFIKYKDFCKWMPIEEKETKSAIENQLKSMHEPFLEFGLIKGFSLEQKTNIKQPYWLMKYMLGLPEAWNGLV